MPARESLAIGGLPIGLAHGVTLARDIPAGQPIRWCDVTPPTSSDALRLRQQMEQQYKKDSE